MTVFLAILRRLLQLLLLSLLVTFATFLLSSLIPGDFFTVQQSDPTIRAETINQLRRQYGLDLPFYQQYLRWLLNFLHTDLGYSLYFRTSVRSVVADAMLKTLWIGLPALVLGLGGGIFLGTLHGIHRDRPLGTVLDFAGTVALSLPSLVLGLGALFLAAHTRWFPLGSVSSASLQPAGAWAWLLDRVHHLALPVICLSIPIFAAVERIQANATGDSRNDPHVRAARARGLGPGRIYFHHLLRPALNPILSTSGPIIGGVLSGSLVLEVIFSWPGLGQMTYDALFNRDVFLLLGCVVGSGALLLTGNLAADLLLYAMDPRTRVPRGGLRP